MNRAIVLLALAPTLALACGVCVEDKVAATYDWGVLQRALAHGQVVVYCEVTGRADAARLRAAAAKVPSVDRESVRFSAEPAAVSFAVDARQSPQATAAAVQRALPAGTHLRVLRVATAKGLQTVAR